MPDGLRQSAERALTRIPPPALIEKADVRRKYGNQPTTSDGIRFDSKRECQRYEVLKILQQKGEVRWFTRQVPFWLSGGTKWLADFVVVWTDGHVTVEDCKGVITPVYRVKRREIQAKYGFQIVEI